jgi:uncharacterized membrane protein
VTWLHVLCGSIVLAIAPLAMIVRKGGRLHNRAGAIFIACMGGVAATALFMWQKKGHLFLVFLDIVVIYLFVYGYRVLNRRRHGFSPADDRIDYALALAVIAGSGLTIWVGFGIDTPLMRDLRWVLAMLGGIGIWFGAWDIYSLATHRLTKTGWMFLHFTAMIAAYVSAVTAFIVINGHSVLMLVRWMAPISIGTIIILYFQFTMRNRLSPVRTKPRTFGQWVHKNFWDLIPPAGGTSRRIPERPAPAAATQPKV